MILFSCDEVGHISTKCPKKDDKDERKFNKYEGKKDFKGDKSYKDKGKKSCYIAKYSNIDEDEMKKMKKMKRLHLSLMFEKMIHGL